MDRPSSELAPRFADAVTVTVVPREVRVRQVFEEELLAIRNDYEAIRADYTPPSSGAMWGSLTFAASTALAVVASPPADPFRLAFLVAISAVGGLGALHFWNQCRREKRAAEQRFSRLSSILSTVRTAQTQ